MSVTIAALGERALRRLGVAVVPVSDRPALSTMVADVTIATNALIELGVIAADETPSTADQALAEAKLAAVQDSLTAQAVTWWGNSAGVPRAVQEEYTKLTALFMASSYGKQADPAQLPMLEGRVRRMALILSSPDLATEAVQGVHDDLASLGYVRWSVFDIPAAVEGPYEIMGANQLAPLFDKPVDVRADAEAMRSIARYIALGTSGETVRAVYF